MKMRLTFQKQVFFSVLVALLIGWSLSGFQIPDNRASTNLEGTVPPKPFTNLTNAWMVRVKVSRLTPPSVVEVIKVGQGRITTTQGGESKIILLNRDSEALYILSFHTQFLAPDLGETLNEVEKVFILPEITGGETIQVVTPQGETRYELP